MASYELEGFAETTTVVEGGSSWLDQEVEFSLTGAAYGGLTLRITGFTDRDNFTWLGQLSGLLLEAGRPAAVFSSSSGAEMTVVFTGAATSATVESFFEGLQLTSSDFEGLRTLMFTFIGADDVQIGEPRALDVTLDGVDSAPQVFNLGPLTGVEDAAVSLSLLEIVDSDSPIFYVLLTTAHGQFFAETVGIATVEGSGTGSLLVGGEAIDVAAVIAAATLLPTLDFSGDLVIDIVTQSGDSSGGASLTVSIAPANDAPTAITLGSGALTVAEGSSASLVIADFDAADPDGDAILFRLLDDAGGRFIMTADGRLSVRTPHLVDFEQASTHAIRVEAVDGRGGMIEATYTLVVGDVLGEMVLGGADADRLVGGVGDDLLLGAAGADVLEGGADNDELKGGAGDDRLVGGAGADELDGGVGNDQADYASAGGAVTVDLLAGTAVGSAGLDRLKAVEMVAGSAFADTLTGDRVRNTLTGGEGDDRLSGGDSHDILAGDAGADTLRGDAGHDTITGGAGDDLVLGGAGNDVLDGATDNDTVSYADATAAVQVSLALTGYQDTLGDGADRLINFENLTGSAYADTLIGAAGANILAGGVGNDALDGAAGNDVLLGGAGDDLLTGGAGVDSASYADAAAGVSVSLAVLISQNTVGAGADRLSGLENLVGSAHADVLTGSAGNNVLSGGAGGDEIDGGAGLDTLSGDAGPDVIRGGEGNDKLYGYAGDDRIEGGAGLDAFYGQEGADTFVFSRNAGADTLYDFTGEDLLAMRATTFGLAAGMLSTSQLQFGSAATGSAGVFLYDSSAKALSWDPDGDGAAAAERIVTFHTAVTLTAADFVLI